MWPEIEEYLGWKASYAERAGIEYRYYLERFNGEMPLKSVEEVTIGDIIRHQRYLSSRYQASTVAYSITIIRNFFEYLKRQGRGVVDPYFLRIPRHASRPHEAITADEFLAIDSILRDDMFFSLQRKVAHHLLYFTGMRVSELCDITLTQVTDQPRMFIENKKNKRYRWIYWPERTDELLRKYLGMRLELAWGPALFTNQKCVDRKPNGHLTTRSIQRWVREWCEAAGIKRRISCHSYRRSRAQRTNDIVLAKEILGHSTVTSTQVYMRYNPEHIEKRARETF